MLPLDPSDPAPARLTSCPSCRSPEALRAVAAQFDVATEARYRPRDTSGDGLIDTHCDAFVGDCTAALGAPIPFWWRAKELSANGSIDWLEKHGPRYGWRRALGDAARAMAAAGRIAVATWRNPAGPGHVALLLPPAPDGTIRIAQAGRRCLFDVPLVEGFGSHPVVFYVHD